MSQQSLANQLPTQHEPFQPGPVRLKKTINVKNNLNEISKGMDMILKKKIKKIVNPYDGGKTTNKVFSIIKNIDLDKILVKKYDY